MRQYEISRKLALILRDFNMPNLLPETMPPKPSSAPPEDYQADQQGPRVTRSNSELTSAMFLTYSQILGMLASGTGISWLPGQGHEYLEINPIIIVSPDNRSVYNLTFAGTATGTFHYVGEVQLVKVDPSNYYLWQEEGQTQMTLRERFQKKLAAAKKRKEEKGDPIARASALIDVPEERADKVLDEHKGYRFVSKKA